MEGGCLLPWVSALATALQEKSTSKSIQTVLLNGKWQLEPYEYLRFFQCIFDTLWKYPILEALWGCLSWENQNHLHQVQSSSCNSSFPSGNNSSNLIMVTGRSKLCVNHCVCSKCKPPWLNYHHLPLQQTSK